MKKVLSILAIILLSGCTKELGYRGKPVIDTKVEEEVIEKTEEMRQFDQVLNSKENIGFLLSTYSSFEKIDFKELLIEFPTNYSTILSHTTNEYKNLILSYPELTDKDIYKMTRANLKKYIKNKTGYAYEDFEKNNINGIAYMEVYDAYYTASKFGENLFDVYKVVVDDNVYNVYYKYNNKKYKTTIKKVDKNYIFTANIVNN